MNCNLTAAVITPASRHRLRFTGKFCPPSPAQRSALGPPLPLKGGEGPPRRRSETPLPHRGRGALRDRQADQPARGGGEVFEAAAGVDQLGELRLAYRQAGGDRL